MAAEEEENLIWVEHQRWQELASSSCFQLNSSNNSEHINKKQRLTKSQSCPLSGFWPGWSVQARWCLAGDGSPHLAAVA